MPSPKDELELQGNFLLEAVDHDRQTSRLFEVKAIGAESVRPGEWQ
jgi:hypothetical protein